MWKYLFSTQNCIRYSSSIGKRTHALRYGRNYVNLSSSQLLLSRKLPCIKNISFRRYYQSKTIWLTSKYRQSAVFRKNYSTETPKSQTKTNSNPNPQVSRLLKKPNWETGVVFTLGIVVVGYFLVKLPKSIMAGYEDPTLQVNMTAVMGMAVDETIEWIIYRSPLIARTLRSEPHVDRAHARWYSTATEAWVQFPVVGRRTGKTVWIIMEFNRVGSLSSCTFFICFYLLSHSNP